MTYKVKHHPVSRAIAWLWCRCVMCSTVLEINKCLRNTECLHHCQCMTNTTVDILLLWHSEVHQAWSLLLYYTNPPANGGHMECDFL